MRKVLRLNFFSAVRFFAVFYAIIGIYNSLKSVFQGAATIDFPIGFHYPEVAFNFSFSFTNPHPVSIATPFAILGAVICYAITGAISSAPFIVLYNATSRFWPAVTATFEPDNRPTELAQQPPSAPPL
ncbi:MAG: hypothetical protein ABR860_11155 [Terracidiphilus sp.]|jgi:hypothetical protein